jgi:hypothetical protein
MSKPSIVREAEDSFFEIRLSGQEIYDLTQHLSRAAIAETGFDEVSLCVFLHHRIVSQAREQGFGLPAGYNGDGERAAGVYRPREKRQ